VPAHEIWVCSPRVEGVHLRGGDIARGGLRWSDRREDFRTEVLGLMKAQMVKNAVIVPTGAKGGFVVKQPPASDGAGSALWEEGRACYRLFVSGLLDVTDNIVGGEVVHPVDTVCYDGDDPYLVVAADKGTATFSDLANSIAAERGFWLGDAFASGGSTGYDHKAMGITARGAWESVRRHARSLDLDADRDELSVVGIGDMSGDVFGNGMLLSPHLRLVAAFDHRHIFLDPDPDPERAHAERRRLFELRGSSWADYDPALISAGGGVFSRAAKSVPLSPQVREVLGVSAASLTPAELVSAVLRAPVDLLWNGGIGTYVKASSETHAEVGDRANDAVRVDAADLRCRMVVEGGNLGLTQRARVEYALAGGLVHTDAIDNSAGVDCSDHEVNLKILLDGLVADGVLPADERDPLLASVTDEVAVLVLEDNRAQTLALTIARSQAHAMVNVHIRYLQLLEAEGWLDRGLEFLPSDKELVARQAEGQGLTPPEFAVMLAYTKAADVTEVLASDLLDDPHLETDLAAYFPVPVRERFGPHLGRHRLRREILATCVVNHMVNLQGISFDHRMTEETGLPVAEVCRGWIVARDVFDLPTWWRAIDGAGRQVPLDVQLQLFGSLRRLIERSTLWLLRRGVGGDVARTVRAYQRGVADLAESMPAALAGEMAERLGGLRRQWIERGVPVDLAARAALWPVLHTGFDLVDLSHHHGRPITVCAQTYWGVFDALDLVWLWDQVGGLPRSRRWESQSRSALREDLLAALAEIADAVLATGYGVADWLAIHDRTVQRTLGILREARRDAAFDLATLTVAVRQLRNLALAVGGKAAPAAPNL
jgi:glutamate dehydrogenase